MNSTKKIKLVKYKKYDLVAGLGVYIETLSNDKTNEHWFIIYTGDYAGQIFCTSDSSLKYVKALND